MNRIASMAEIGSEYQTVNTVVTTTGDPVQLLIPANTRRFYLRVYTSSFSGFYSGLLPGPPINPFGVIYTQPAFHEYKFNDSPSICQGEFYLYGAAPGQDYFITECVYNGD